MDLLKTEEGFSLIEVLTGIVLLGLVLTFSMLLFNRILTFSKSNGKSEALLLASTEIDRSLNGKRVTDTTYYNSSEKLMVERNVNKLQDTYQVNVLVKPAESEKVLIKLQATFTE